MRIKSTVFLYMMRMDACMRNSIAIDRIYCLVIAQDSARARRHQENAGQIWKHSLTYLHAKVPSHAPSSSWSDEEGWWGVG
jgi:hypothetical protein